MSQFTPGPWADIGVDDRDNGGRRVYGGDEIIAYVCGTDEEQAEANAALIARAPTLLRERDELREALEAARSWLREYHACHTDAADDGLHGLSEQMDAVLSKVTP